ncbi:MAG TPA: fatty acid desaturase family protein [Pseudomonadales bacterium]
MTVGDTVTESPARLDRFVSREELAACLARSDWKASGVLALNYAIIAGAFALAILWPNPLTILVSVAVLGGRQLGLEVLNHDCAHSVFFRRRRVNELVGHWLCGGPMNTSLYRYRDYHLGHHRFAGTPQDPDLGIASAYPATPDSLRRKLTRDLTGRTGLRDTWRQLRRLRPRRNAPFLVSHAVLLGALTLAGAPWAYLLWWAAYLFVYPFVTRLRFMSEHGVARDRLAADPRINTCSTLVSWWERLLVAPNRVNYHVEHHLQAGVPLYNLPRFHRLLKKRGYFDGFDCLSRGYRDVLRRATRHTGAEAPPAAA